MTDLGLFNFIKKELAQGRTKEQISEILKGKWSPAEIESAFADVLSGKTPVIQVGHIDRTVDNKRASLALVIGIIIPIAWAIVFKAFLDSRITISNVVLAVFALCGLAFLGIIIAVFGFKAHKIKALFAIVICFIGLMPMLYYSSLNLQINQLRDKVIQTTSQDISELDDPNTTTLPKLDRPTITSVTPAKITVTGRTGLNSMPIKVVGQNFSSVRVHIINPQTGQEAVRPLLAETGEESPSSSEQFAIKIPDFIRAQKYNIVVENTGGLKSDPFTIEVVSTARTPDPVVQSTVPSTPSAPVKAVNNSVNTDAVLPKISILSPISGSTVSNSVMISAQTSDNVGVAWVEFYKNGVLFEMVWSAPFTATWNTKTETNGTFNLSAKAYDNTGNVGFSNRVSVIVNN